MPSANLLPEPDKSLPAKTPVNSSLLLAAIPTMAFAAAAAALRASERGVRGRSGDGGRPGVGADDADERLAWTLFFSILPLFMAAMIDVELAEDSAAGEMR